MNFLCWFSLQFDLQRILFIISRNYRLTRLCTPIKEKNSLNVFINDASFKRKCDWRATYYKESNIIMLWQSVRKAHR